MKGTSRTLYIPRILRIKRFIGVRLVYLKDLSPYRR